MDGLQTLTKIVALREESMGPEHITTGEALFTVSLVYWYSCVAPRTRDRPLAVRKILSRLKCPRGVSATGSLTSLIVGTRH